MKGKLVYIVLTVMIAVTVGYASDISAYIYDVKVAEGMKESAVERVYAPETASVVANPVKQSAVRSAQHQTEQTLEELEPGEWDYLFGDELDAIQKGLEEGQDIWTAFPTIEDDPESPIAILCQIVQAEAGGEDTTGQTMVANVVLNRIRAGFGEDVKSVVFAPGQFDPVETGYYYMVEPSESVCRAVYLAIQGNDYSRGALFFCTFDGESPFFITDLEVTISHGSHVFYRYR